MFETTFGVLQESPLAIVPLVAIVWFVALGIRRSNIVARIARYVFVLGVIPPFCLFLLADVFGSQSSRGLARTLLGSEVRLVTDTLDVLDTLTAAVLRAFLQVVSGIVPNDPLAGMTSVLPSWNPFPVASAVGFLVAVFVAHFVAGLVVTRITRWQTGDSLADEWLTAAGVVLFVSGMVWMLLQFDLVGVGRFELRTAVLASSMGLVSGVTVSNLPVKLLPWRSDGTNAGTNAETTGVESGTDAPTAREKTRTRPRSGTRSARPSATETAGADASTTESTSRSEIGELHPSFERLQETVQSLLRR